MYIVKSVGLGGKNQKSDVAFVQDLLNVIGEEDMRFPRLVVDGRYGNNTKKAIGLFQLHYVKLRQLDYRIDPNGRSEKTLIAKNIEIDNSIVPSAAQKHGLKREKKTISSGGARNINYRSNAKKVVSIYSENIIKLAMGYAGINKCDISSTLRSIDDQVRIMYGNILRFPGASSVSSLKSLRKWGYAAPGRAVEAVYFEKRSQVKRK